MPLDALRFQMRARYLQELQNENVHVLRDFEQTYWGLLSFPVGPIWSLAENNLYD